MKSIKLVCIGVGMLAFTACAGSPQSTVKKEAAATEVKPVMEEAPIVAALPKASEEASELEFEVPEVSILKGKAPGEIEAIFGTPVLKRRDKPTEMWQYLTNTCALHLVFYPEGKDGPLSVQYISMNSRETVKSVPTDTCFESQLRRLGAEKVKDLTS